MRAGGAVGSIHSSHVATVPTIRRLDIVWLNHPGDVSVINITLDATLLKLIYHVVRRFILHTKNTYDLYGRTPHSSAESDTTSLHKHRRKEITVQKFLLLHLKRWDGHAQLHSDKASKCENLQSKTGLI